MLDKALQDLADTCETLGIPEYLEGLTREEILVIALYYLEVNVKSGVKNIYEAIHEGE